MVQQPNEYLSVEALKFALRDTRPAPNSFDDAYLIAIRAASEQIEEHCDQRFWRDATATALLFRAEEARVLWTGPIADATNLVIEFDEDDDGVFETTLTAADWQLGPVDRRPGKPYYEINLVGGRWFPGAWRNLGYSGALRTLSYNHYGQVDPRVRSMRARVRVTAHWGWPAVPWQVVQACQILAIDNFKSKDMTGNSAGTPMTAAGSFGAQAAYQVKGGGFNPRAAALLCGLREYVIA